MNKDAILASVIGFGIGLLITGAILVGPSLLPLLKQVHKSGSVQSATTQSTPSPTQPTLPTATFSIDSPSDQTIAQDTTMTISGHAPEAAIIVIDGSQDEAVTQGTAGNTFQGQVTLKEGINDISVTNVGPQNTTTKHITVYYTPKS